MNKLDILKKYTIKIEYIDGRVEELDVVGHRIDKGILDIQKTDDTFMWVILSNVKSIKFDKMFTKILEDMNGSRSRQN